MIDKIQLLNYTLNMSKATVTIVFETAGEQENFKKSLRRVKDSKKIKYSKIVQNAILEYEQKNCQDLQKG